MKRCNKCSKLLPFENFAKSVRQEDNLAPRCRDCERIRHLEYRHTAKGLISQMYSGQKRRSLSKWNISIDYSRKQLLDWVTSQYNWEELFNQWAANGYRIEDTPSVDRIDCLLPYSMGNIQLMSWSDNKSKGHKERATTITYSSNKTGHRGVSFDTESGKYALQLTINRERKTIGRYPTIEEAVRVKENYERKY